MMRFAVAFLTGLAALALALPAAAQLTEGKEYTRLKNPQPVETGKKIEVIEFFSYGCPHCNDLEPFLDAWVSKLPPDVQFRRVPVMFQQRWEALARIYYTLDALGEEQRLSPEVFKAIHVNNVPLYQDKAFFDWAASKGLDRNKVADIYNSFAVSSKFNRAKSLAAAYNIQSVPTIVVDGKFITASDRVGTHASLPAAIDALVAKARAERTKG
ncbi:MAG TPA: thiol:disulfide interchange protein DsbA/DsbL [Casimicrobiaceae bacterium]|nr:thiol:disulfide interchange protein DsbA/DsbL [Casimicrobiaceae bacterium]